MLKKLFEKYDIQIKLLLILTTSLIVLIFIFYFMLPDMLNYPKGTYGTSFQHELEKTDYTSQVITIGVSIFAIYFFIIFFNTRFLIDINKKLKINNITPTELNKLKKKLFNSPYQIYIMNIVLPVIIITLVHALTTQSMTVKILKIILLLFSFITISSTICLVFTRRLFTEVLEKLPYSTNTNYRKIKITKRISYHILPLFIVGIIFTALLGYSRLTREKGDVAFEIYKDRLTYNLSDVNIKSEDELINIISNIKFVDEKDYLFIYTPNNEYIKKDKTIIKETNFFTKYMKEMSPDNGGRVYEYYGEDTQAATYDVFINGEKYTVGIYYYLESIEIINYFIATFIILLSLNILVLKLFTNTLAFEIQKITDQMLKIIQNKSISSKNNLPLISNDEIGDLTNAFNQIQELTIENIDEIKKSKDIIMEKERLASLGQLIGGISHNLKSPIMSIAGAVQGIENLTNEYKQSVRSNQVTIEDHDEIAKEMLVWLAKIRVHIDYMSDVITAVKGQAVAFSNNNNLVFTVEELIKQVTLLMKHEASSASISLEIVKEVDDSLNINGNISSLVQVINNMISNSIQSYEGKVNEKIQIRIYTENNEIIFAVKDYGKGIPKNIQEKLFKEMVTTKGKNGSGLGIFMSYSNIKGHFNGEITLESIEGKGTTFYIHIPLI